MQIGKPQVVAHRGHGNEPENTLRAFRAGMAAGADRVELDIQSTADGDFVVLHDPTVDRTTNGQGKVKELTTDQVRQLDAGQGEKVPLLAEVLDWARQHDVPLTLEMKHPLPGEAEKLVEMVRDSQLRDPWVISFKPDFVEKVEALAPEIKTGVLVHERPLFNQALKGSGVGLGVGLAGALLSGLAPLPLVGAVAASGLAGAAGGFALSLRSLRRKDLDRQVDMHIPGRRILNAKVVDRARERGKEVAVYTVDKPRQIRRFTDMGVDGLITNYPERIKG